MKNKFSLLRFDTWFLVLFVVLFASSTFWLFAKNQTGLDPNTYPSWIETGFIDPQNTHSLDFFIQNSANTSEEITYTVTNQKKELLKEEVLTLLPNERKEIALSQVELATITIYHKGQTYILSRK